MPSKNKSKSKKKAKAKTKNKQTPAQLQGEVFVGDQQKHAITTAQIQLLQAIESGGSITAAAKHVGISYKTAWDRIDAMNNLAEQALVMRVAGGSKGGGTVLTDYGKKIVAGFVALNAEHSAFLQRVGGQLHSFDDIAKFLKGSTVNTSARNQFRGVITGIKRGEVNAEVEVKISGTQSIVATITRESLKQMQLKKGASVIALIKASWVILTSDSDAATSARNKLPGKIIRTHTGAVNSDVVLDIGEGKSLSATITNASVKAMKIKAGMDACGLFKASSVILMAD